MNCRGARDPSAADLPEVPRTSSPSSAPTSWAGAIFRPPCRLDLVDQLREHSELMPYVQTVASSILITMDRGRCRLCCREDTRLSFGETSRRGGRPWPWLGDRGVELRSPARRRPHGSDRDTGKSQAPRLLN